LSEAPTSRRSSQSGRNRFSTLYKKHSTRRWQDDPASGVYRVSRDIFTDPDIFELEMKYIFEGNWIYLAHESQIPNKNDYFTAYMGRQPIFIARKS
jgi:hypothetical protein